MPRYSAPECFAHLGHWLCAAGPNVRVCVTNLAPPVRPWDRYILLAIPPVVTSGPTSAHRNDHQYTSGHCTAESRQGWQDGPDSPPPSIHRLTSTSCRSIRPPIPSSPYDKGLIAPEWWAERWAIVCGRSPRPAH